MLQMMEMVVTECARAACICIAAAAATAMLWLHMGLQHAQCTAV
jgi:hypothetical protein